VIVGASAPFSLAKAFIHFPLARLAQLRSCDVKAAVSGVSYRHLSPCGNNRGSTVDHRGSEQPQDGHLGLKQLTEAGAVTLRGPGGAVPAWLGSNFSPPLVTRVTNRDHVLRFPVVPR
jgi:hypothetical protein